jgi:hypothetical protein
MEHSDIMKHIACRRTIYEGKWEIPAYTTFLPQAAHALWPYCLSTFGRDDECLFLEERVVHLIQ